MRNKLEHLKRSKTTKNNQCKNLIDSSKVFNAGQDSRLTSYRSTQVSGQHRSLKVNYVFSTKTNIGPVQDERHPPTMPHDHLTAWSCEVMWQIKNKNVLFYKAHSYQTMMPRDPLTTSSCEVMWQNESLISPLPQGLWSPNFAG